MGGLGNNLFQLANVYSIHKKYEIPYFIPNFVDRGNIHLFNQSTKLEIDDLFENKFNFDNLQDNQSIYIYNHFDINPNNDFKYKPVHISDNTCYNGYFQSDKYFLNFDIKNEFKLKLKLLDEVREKYSSLFNKPTIALHYRLGGDRVLENMQHYHKNVSKDFYLNALDIICKNNISKYNILLFSDNLEQAKKILNNIDLIEINNDNDNIKDFALMSLCDYNILGNSTFSWWSAYLNQNNVLTIAPKSEWFGQGYKHFDLQDLFPKNWIVL
jgi:hypothetical protein